MRLLPPRGRQGHGNQNFRGFNLDHAPPGKNQGHHQGQETEQSGKQVGAFPGHQDDEGLEKDELDGSGGKKEPDDFFGAGPRSAGFFLGGATGEKGLGSVKQFAFSVKSLYEIADRTGPAGCAKQRISRKLLPGRVAVRLGPDD